MIKYMFKNCLFDHNMLLLIETWEMPRSNVGGTHFNCQNTEECDF